MQWAVGFWWANISHHLWIFSILNAFNFKKTFSVLTEEDAGIVEDTKKTQLINFFCNFSTFQIAGVSVLSSLHSLLDMGPKLRFPSHIISHSTFDSILVHFLPPDYLAISEPSQLFLFYCFFFFVYDEHFHHTGFLKWKLTSRSFHMSGNRNLGTGCHKRTFLCVQIFPLSSSVTLQHQHTASVSSSQVLRSHMLEWLAELEKAFDIS